MTAAAISSTTPKVHCYQCDKELDKVMECAKCHIAKYCGKECQTAAWKSGHKAECKKWQVVKSIQDANTTAADILSEMQTQIAENKGKLPAKVAFEAKKKMQAHMRTMMGSVKHYYASK